MFCNTCRYYNQYNQFGTHTSYATEYSFRPHPTYFPTIPPQFGEMKRNPFLTASITNGNINIGLRHPQSQNETGSISSSANSSASSIDSGKTGSPSPHPSDADDSLDSSDRQEAENSPQRVDTVKSEPGKS